MTNESINCATCGRCTQPAYVSAILTLGVTTNFSLILAARGLCSLRPVKPR